jgi:hypothetical protein
MAWLETSFLDLRSPDDPRWPQLNEAAILYAYAVAEPDRDPWCLFTCWRPELPVEDNWGHVGWVSKQLPLGTDVQLLVAHYRGRPGARTRFEPWIFAAREMEHLVEALLRRHRQDLAFWSDGCSVYAMSPGTTRCLGELRHGALAHAICESSSKRSSFLGFDLPTSTCVEAMARTSCVGADSQ